MIIPDIDDLILEYDEESGIEELGRRILSRGSWASIAFLVRTRRDSDAEWEGPFLWLHRYQKVAQGWKLASRFHTTDKKQLDNMLDALKEWELI
jgi:hypothetical protein